MNYISRVPNLFVSVPQNTTWRHLNSPLHLLGEILKFRDVSIIFNTYKVMPRPRHLHLLLSTGSLFNIINNKINNQ